MGKAPVVVRPVLQYLDTNATIEQDTEMRDLARVIKAALGVLIAYWNQATCYPTMHPYRHAARMVIAYLERRYGV